jgi:hypothetical protein
MTEWNDKTAHQAEMELLDAEKEGRDKSFFLGEADFRGNLDEDPSRHNLLGMNASEYRVGWQSEAKFERNMERIRANRPAQAEAERQVLKSMALHTEEVIKKLKLPSQRYHVWLYNSLNCLLNPDAEGFATHEAATLEVDRLLTEDSCVMAGDSVVLEDKGVTLSVHEKEAPVPLEEDEDEGIQRATAGQLKALGREGE